MPVFQTTTNDNRSIVIKTSAELMENQIPASLVDPHHSMLAAKDINGEAMLFAHGNDGILYAYLRSRKSSTGWQQYDLTSALRRGGSVQAFEIAQGHDGLLQLGIAVGSEEKSEDADLYLTDHLPNDPEASFWENFQGKWVSRPINIKVAVSKIYIGRNDSSDTEPLCLAALSSAGRGLHYQVNTNITSTAWATKEYKLPENASVLHDICVGTQYGEWGVFALYDTVTGKTLEFTTLPDSKYGKTSSYNYELPAGVEIISISAVPGEEDSYDLYASGDGVYAWLGGDEGLPSTIAEKSVAEGIHHMIVREEGDNVTIWTVQQDNELRYIYGNRTKGDWSAQIPVAQNISQIAAIRNGNALQNQLFMVGADNTLWHLFQNSSSTLWQKSRLPLPSLEKVIDQKTYTTRVTIRDEFEQPLVGKDAVFELSASEWTYVTVNGVNHSVDQKNPIIVQPDPHGVLTIVSEVDSISTPHFCLSSDFIKSGIPIDPSHQVLDRLKKIKGVDELRAACSSDGSKIFDDHSEEVLSRAASAISQLADITHSLKVKQFGTVINSATFAIETSLTTAAQRAASIRSAEDVGEFLLVEAGDFFSWAASGLLEAGEWIIEIVEDVAHFTYKWAGKIINFVIDTAEKGLKAINWVFKEVLGIDLEKIIEWIGFIFNWKHILRTHEVLTYVVNQTIDFGQSKIVSLEDKIVDWFDDLKEQAQSIKPEKYGHDSVKSKANEQQQEHGGQNEVKEHDSPQNNWGNHHLQHSGATKVTGPDHDPADPLKTFVDKTLIPAFHEIEDSVKAIIEDIKKGYNDDSITPAQMIQQITGDVLVGIIDTIKKLVKGLLETLNSMIELFQQIINAKINIPFFSGFYKKFVEKDLSILDAICLIAAVPATILYKALSGHAPFPDAASVEKFTNIDNLFVALGDKPVPSSKGGGHAGYMKPMMLMAAPPETQGGNSSAQGGGFIDDVAKIYSYMGGIVFPITAGISSVLRLVVLNTEMNKVAGEVETKAPVSAKANPENWAFALSLVGNATSFPIGNDKEIGLQRTTWGINTLWSVVDFATSKISQKIPILEDSATFGRGVALVTKSIICFVIEAIIFAEESEDLDDKAKREDLTDDQKSTEKSMNLVKLFQNIILMIAEGTEGVAMGLQPLAKDPATRTAMLGFSAVSGGTYIIGNFLDLVRLVVNIDNDLTHQNY